MATRAGSKPHVRRAPLGDATDRILNASPQKQGKHDKPPGPKPNPLRSHPTGGPPIKVPVRKYMALSSGAPTSNLKGPDVSGNANPQVSSAVRTATPCVEESAGDKRFSQISASSGASSGNRKTHIGPWQLGKTLGKGSAARVRLARHRSTQDIVAIKILAKNMTQLTAAGSMAELDKWDRTRDEFTSQRQMPLSIEREVAILKLIDHPHIVKLHDIWENRAEIYLVLEYMNGGDLFTYINACGPLPEFEMVGYFRQILAALGFIHSFNIYHRDLKPENILMQSNGVVKIADFGMAAIQQSPTHALRTSCGSPHYAAPELIARYRYQGDKVDIWSLGCILYAALCKRLPFDDPDGDVPKLLAKAAKGIYFVPDFLSRGAQDLIAKMLTVEPLKRIPIQKIWQHPLIRKYDDLDDLNDGGLILDSRATDKSKPVPPEELDLQILRQLKSMWHTFSEKQIAMLLSNAQSNDQKLFYWLLLAYREKELENYDTNLTHSPSDYHHLRPANWKKKFTTAEFPSRYRRTPSRFTVISTVPTDGSIEGADNATDGGATIQSYDPYKSSRIIENVYASHAKIVVHRNGSTANNSSRSSASRHARSGSFRSNSNHSRQARGGHRMAIPATIRGSRHSLSSIQSNSSMPYTRPASRRKRGVNFSHVQRQSVSQRGTECKSAGVVGDNSTSGCGVTSSRNPVGYAQLPHHLDTKGQAITQSLANAAQANQGGLHWNEDVRKFSHSIAQDCDEAFNSPLLSQEPCPDNTTSIRPSISAGGASLSVGLTTPALNPDSNTNAYSDAHRWDHRPLPPTPTTSAMRGADAETAGYYETSLGMKHGAPRASGVNAVRGLANEEVNWRAVSAPIYSQYSTQWGKDKIPLPSISEKSKGHYRNDSGDKPRVMSAPVGYVKVTSLEQMDDPTGLEFLSRRDKTIRIVNSPSRKQGVELGTSQSVDARQKMSQVNTTYTHFPDEPNLRQRYMNDGLASSSLGPRETPSDDATSATVAMRRPSWFKRGSKDKESVLDTKGDSTSSRTDRLTYTSTNSSTGPAIPPAKKKSFNLAFWRNSRDQTEMRLSLAESEDEDVQSQKPARMFSHPNRPPLNGKRGDEATIRNIEPQQNWLARLFRVKPATKYLCFSISRRRARQEMVILLKEWRKYGIRDVQVDRGRNIVFARVGQKNYLNMKEVAFAVEVMTVIEHGRRNQLCIARFTQERGAASSFHKVVDTMNSVFSVRNLLVVEKRKSKMMIKTLNS
ncbi:hypothetical protein F4861DRAFT_509466 [Xylaria intraflava]|nr:hypothetical protein F4861DRAFT_509466 [Xylaria intraflava]